MEDLAKRFPEDTRLQYINLPEIRAQLARNRRQPEKVLDVLRVTVPYELGRSTSMLPAYIRGQAFLAAHNDADAASEFRRVIEYRGIVQNDIIGALAHLQLGRAYPAPDLWSLMLRLVARRERLDY